MRSRPPSHATADPQGLPVELLTRVYDELRALAGRALRRERIAHTLQPTALVHEVYLRLLDQKAVVWQGRTQIFALAARMMRRILVDHARRRTRHKRGGDAERVILDEALVPGGTAQLSLPDLLAVHEALSALAELDGRQAEIVEQRYFGGLTAAEIAAGLGLGQRTVEAELAHARAWLRQYLEETSSESSKAAPTLP